MEENMARKILSLLLLSTLFLSSCSFFKNKEKTEPQDVKEKLQATRDESQEKEKIN